MTGKKVLICDDEPFIIESVGYVVKKLGYNYDIAENGEEALRQARKLMPDVMVLDIGMPKVNGYDVCRALKSDVTTKQIYIVILTAFGQKRDEELAIAAGADEFLTKPFSPRQIRSKLEIILDPIKP